MTEYRVLYITIEPGADRRRLTELMDHECDRQASEGWRLVTAVPDTDAGTTCGVWLYFASDLNAESLVAELEREVSADAER